MFGLPWTLIHGIDDDSAMLAALGRGAADGVGRIVSPGVIYPDLAELVPEGPVATLRPIYVDTASVTAAPAMAALAAWLPASMSSSAPTIHGGDPLRVRTELNGLRLAPERPAAIEDGNAGALMRAATASGG